MQISSTSRLLHAEPQSLCRTASTTNSSLPTQQKPEDSAAKAQLAEAQVRLQQSRGEYTAGLLYFTRAKQDWKSFSSYTNPKLSIKHIPG